MQEKITHAAQSLLPHLVQYRYPLIGAIIVGVYAFAVFRIDTVLQTTRDEEAFSAQQVEIQKVKFDQTAAEQIRNLEKSPAEINASLEANRQNPFQ